MAAADQLRTLTNPAFRFVVDIDDNRLAAFTECTLPVIEFEVEEIKEGGLNAFTHLLPGRRKAARVSLKNGVGKSELLDWYVEVMGETFNRKSVTITLLDSKKEDVLTWQINGAYPVKWTGPQLKSSDNTIAIQTLELACGEITVS